MEKKSQQSNETKPAGAQAENKETSRRRMTKEQLEAMGCKVLESSGRGYILPMGRPPESNTTQRVPVDRPETCVLPPRPNEFDCHFGFDKVPEGILPKSGRGKHPHFLAEVEWATGPLNSGRDEYHLQGARRHWVLWTRSYDDNWGEWNWQSLGYVAKTGVSLDAAAVHLLIEYFKWSNGNSAAVAFDLVGRTGFLSMECIEKIRDLVWPTNAGANIEAMDLDARIVAVADDVDSRRDEYRSIEPYELADLLGVPFARQPEGHWDRTYFVPRPSIVDCFCSDGLHTWPTILEPRVSARRLRILERKFAKLRKAKKLKDSEFAFMTNAEKDTAINSYMDHASENTDAVNSVATYTIKVPDGRQLRFEVTVGDGGDSSDPKTPYDDRDRKFQDLSDCLIID